jgi:hypothetical protein
MPSSEAGLPLLLVVEGVNDIQFLKVLPDALRYALMSDHVQMKSWSIDFKKFQKPRVA